MVRIVKLNLCTITNLNVRKYQILSLAKPWTARYTLYRSSENEGITSQFNNNTNTLVNSYLILLHDY